MASVSRSKNHSKLGAALLDHMNWYNAMIPRQKR
jgi:hypothetical protein